MPIKGVVPRLAGARGLAMYNTAATPKVSVRLPMESHWTRTTPGSICPKLG